MASFYLLTKEDPHKDHPLYCKNTEGGLIENEFFWREHQQWLADAGYMLQARYREECQPSWLNSNKLYLQCEDAKVAAQSCTLDAIRTSDGCIVTIKKVEKCRSPWEDDIIRFSSSEPLASDPHNHTVPLYEVLESPLNGNITFLVMPHLIRIHEVKFATIGETLECFRRLFEGLQHMPSNLVAHCDISVNLLMEPTPLLSETPHPTRPKRSYDFKGDQTVRWSDSRVKSCSLDFLRPFVDEMTRAVPEQRPTMDEASKRSEDLRSSLPERTLPARLGYRDEFIVARMCHACRHVVRTAKYVRKGLPAPPTPPVLRTRPLLS